MDFSSGDIISIFIFLFGLIASYVKFREKMIEIEKTTDKEISLLKQEMVSLTKTNSDREIKFEKVLEKLEIAIEELNKSQMELSKAIILLQSEIKNKN